MHIKCIFSQGVCMHVDHLSQFAQQLRNTSQSLCGSSEVSVLKDQLHQLRVSSAHCLLQNCTHSSTQPSLPCTAPMRFTEDAYVGRQGKVLKGQWKLDTNDLFVWFQTCVIFSFFPEEYTQRYSPESHGNSFKYNERERGLGLSISKNENINIELSACVVYSKIYHSSYAYMHPNNPLIIRNWTDVSNGLKVLDVRAAIDLLLS